MNYRRLLNLYHEFKKKLEEQHTLYLDSTIGFKFINARLGSIQKLSKDLFDGHEYGEASFQDTCLISYEALCGEDLVVQSTIPLMRQGEVKKRTKENGNNYWLIGFQCIVSMYSYWEVYLRNEIANALGKEKNEIKHPIWGDMRWLRHSVIHHDCIAKPEIVKCEIIKWYKPGDQIRLSFQQMNSIFKLLAFYRNELHKLSLPSKTGIQVHRER